MSTVKILSDQLSTSKLLTCLHRFPVTKPCEFSVGIFGVAIKQFINQNPTFHYIPCPIKCITMYVLSDLTLGASLQFLDGHCNLIMDDKWGNGVCRQPRFGHELVPLSVLSLPASVGCIFEKVLILLHGILLIYNLHIDYVFHLKCFYVYSHEWLPCMMTFYHSWPRCLN